MGIRLSGLMSNMDTEALVSELVSAYKYKKDEVVKDQTKLEWKQDAWKDMNTEIYSFYTGSLSSAKYASNFANMKSTNVSDTTKATVTANGTVANGTQTLSISQIAKASYLTGMALDSSVTDGSKLVDDLGLTEGTIKVLNNDGTEKGSITIDSETTIDDFTKQLKKMGLNASYDTTYNRFFINSSETGISGNFSFEVAGTDDEKKATISNLSKLGLATKENITAYNALEADPEKKLATSKFAAYQAGTNCEFKLNGAEFSSEKNDNIVNGLTITAKAVTNGDISITTATDVDGIYDKIKGLFDDYNKLINKMTAAYNAESAGKYNPLTDEEKEAMSDDQVEKWEKKIKDSLLRRDSTLSGVMTAMTSALSSYVEIDGKKYSLSNFGIKTAGYFAAAQNENNAYHIDGNKEDSLSGTTSDKLRTAIEQDPDTVMKFFSQLASKVYSNLSDKMKSTTMSSAYKVYNDKEMATEVKDYESKVKKWEEKVKEQEDYWYKKFTAMEKALASLQEQQNSVASMLNM